MKTRLALTAFLTFMVTGACSSKDEAGSDTRDTSTGETSDTADTATDSTGDTGSDTAPETTDPDGSDGTSNPDSRDGVTPLGLFGDPCTGNADCESGYCLDAYEGRVCSTLCTSGCIDGWSCQQDLTKFPDLVFVCTPSFPTLCSPCRSNSECQGAGATAESRCLPRGDGSNGSFCGGDCAATTCPEGYRCEAAVDLNGRETPQCVPADGAECECSGPAIAAAASTDCWRENPLGRCEGARVCTASGLTDCDAATPAEDLCNGLDDDCDGETDESHLSEGCQLENTFGACPGMTVCSGASGPTCAGTPPAAERCDGLDNDCDGETDGEGALGCSSYFLDADGDAVGTGAARCLCGPDGDFTARVGGDCDDSRGNVNPNAAEVCDGLDNDCDTVIDDDGAIGCSVFYRDLDLDQFGDQDVSRCLCAADTANRFTSKTPTDCDDQSDQVNPGAPETCDGIDNDCDGQIDEQGAGGCVLHFVDGDADSYGNPSQFACLCGPNPTYPVSRGGDCDDNDEVRSPGSAERCDFKDNDCDGLTDETDATGCTTFHRDSDGDTFGVDQDTRCLCGPATPWDAVSGGDCNDAVPAVNPAATEACNGQDDDCDTVVDEAGALECDIYFEDVDFDSFGRAGSSACLCAPSVPFVSINDDDCDDLDPFSNPSAAEVCNQKDDDCDGQTDEGVFGNCSPFYYDGDGDGWGLADQSQCLCAPSGLFRATKAGDCDDTNPTTHPFSAELCNVGAPIDDDCDGLTDEEGASGCSLRYRDVDGDLVGRFGEAKCLCASSGEFRAPVGGDCDDGNAQVRPGAVELCNGVDDDCDGTIDPASSTGCTNRLRDSDQDGFGSGEGLCLCAPSLPFTATVGGDCNDADPAVSPGDPEICNGKDDDCSGVADDPGTTGCVPFFADQDGDAWGVSGDSQCLCAPTSVYKAVAGGDCDDVRNDVNPAVIERCNGRDDDCDGSTDEAGGVGCEVRLRDGDGDGFGVDGQFACVCQGDPVFRTDVGGDCDDTRGNVYPGGPELCDGRDNDCDRLTDEEGAQGCVTWLRDTDGDGFGVTGDSKCLCSASATYRADEGGDCNDGSLLVSPAALEFCNGTDDDCDGQTDEEGATGCVPHYVDGDGDGYGVGAGRCLCGPSGAFVVTQAGDCADNDPLRNPGRLEQCAGDGRDEDCDGSVDEANATGCVDRFVDADDDGYGVTTSRTCLCGPTGNLTATVGGDCNDTSDLVNPGEAELCNGRDDDCDGGFDEGCGMLNAGWPTAKYDHRRSGWGVAYDGPNTKTLKWKTRLNTATDGLAGTDIQTSAVFDQEGRLYIAVENRLYRLNAATGAIVWQRSLRQPMSDAASVTIRTGGTMAIPTGNGVSLFDRDGNELWYRKLPGAETEPITGAPLVDDSGNIYVVGFSAAYSLDSAGAVRWSVAVPNSQYVQSHVAWNKTNDRIYFGCSNHTLFALTRTGQIAWTYVVAGADVDASTVVLLDGSLVQSFGNNYHQVRDDGNVGTLIRSFSTGGDNDTPPIAWRNSQNVELIISNANGNTGVRTYRASDGNLNWTYAMVKDQSIPNTSGAIDKTGRIYIGDDEGGFHAITTTGTNLWKFVAADGLSGTEIQSTVALQQGVVFFGDNAGWLYALGQ